MQNGDPLDTSTIGTHDFIVTAVDNAGNERSRTFTYTVEVTPPAARRSEFRAGDVVEA